MTPPTVYKTNLLCGSTSSSIGLTVENDTYPARSDRCGMQGFLGGDLKQETWRSEA